MRRFSRGPNTLFEYRPGMPLADLGGIFTGPANRAYLDVNGVLRYAALNEPRDNHWINGKRTFLRENSAINLVTRSEEFDHADWAKSNGGAGSLPVVTANAAIGPDLALSADKVVFSAPANGDNSFLNQNPAVVASNLYAFGFWVQAFAAGDIGKQIIFRQVAGAAYTVVTLTAAWQFVSSVALSVNTLGNIQIGLRPVVGGGSAGTVTVNLFGAQLELGTAPSSYIKTTSAAVTRAADNLSFAWTAAPQLMTGLMSGVAVSFPGGNRLFQLSGPNDNGPRYLVYFPSNTGSLFHQNANGGSTVQADSPTAISNGDEFGFRTVLRADGSVLAGKTLNGVDAGTSAPTAALALAGAWGSGGPARLYIGSDGAGAQGVNVAVTSIRFVKGEQSMAYMGYDFLNAISSDSAEFVHLLEFQFASGTVRLVTGAQDLNWNSVSWEAIGGLLEIGGIEETSDARAQGLDVRLSGVDQTVLAVLLGSQYRGRVVQIWRAHLDRTTGQLVGDPFLIFKGLQLSPYTVDEERSRTDGTVRISTRLSGYFGVERIRGIMTNLASHQHYFSDVDTAKIAATNAYDQQVTSVEGFFAGAFAQIQAGPRPSEVIFGLNPDPQTDAGFASIDFAINLTGNPGHSVVIYESGVSVGPAVATTWDVNDIFTIAYDNNAVTYYKNGAVIRTVVVGPGLTFYFDSSYYGGLNDATYGIARLKNIRFGPDITLFRSSFVASTGVLLSVTPDLFFQHSASLANVKVYWGTHAPMAPGNTGTTDNPHRRSGGGDRGG